MKNLLKKMKNREGFTLAELLIVVAIIAVLVAISIPIFTNQLEKSREAVDAANIRAAYAEVMAAGISEDSANYTKKVKLKQQQTSWQNTFDFPSNITAGNVAPAKSASVTVEYNAPTASKQGSASVSIKLK